MKRALITGVTGQDGSYLAEFLLGKPDYEVHGLVRRSSSLNRQRIDHLFALDPSIGERFHLHYADLADASSLAMVMELIRPDEVYNLGAQSHVRVSFDQPLYTADVVGLGSLARSRSRPAVEPIHAGEVLPGVELGDVWRGTAAARARYPLPSPQSLCLCQALRPLADHQLSRSLWALRLFGHLVQPRKPTPRRIVRHPQGHTRAPRESRKGFRRSS